MAAGGGFLDFDNDHRLDVVFVVPEIAARESREDIGVPRSCCRLLRQTENGTFTDVSEAVQLPVFDGYGMGVAVADVNNDGFVDLYVSLFGPDCLMLNEQGERFRDVTTEAGIANERWSASVCFLDYDRDGWLDIYVTNYVDYYRSKECFLANGDPDFCGPQVFPGTVDVLYHNRGGDDGPVPPALPQFENVTLAAGIAQRSGPGLGVASADFSGDGWPDVFVTNDGAANSLWINQRDGTFLDEAVIRGCAYDPVGKSRAGMGIAIADVDRNQTLDVLVTHLSGESNGLFFSDTQGGFQDGARTAGLQAGSFPYTGFGAAFVDIEHDGDLDLIVVNGRVRKGSSARQAQGDDDDREHDAQSFWSAYEEPAQLYRNDGEARFVEVPRLTQPFCTRGSVARGLATGDVDDDGDMDLLVTFANGPPRLYLNVAENRGAWLKVRAVEPRFGGRDAYGAEVTVRTAESAWRALISPGASYLSSHEPVAHFGLGAAQSIREIEVHWANGDRELFPGGAVNQFRLLEHGEGRTL